MALSLVRIFCLWLAIVATAINVSYCDVSGTTPPRDSCFCPSVTNLIVRDAPCGNQIDTRGINQCFTFTGNKEACTLDIEYEFFEVQYVGQTTTGWIVGNYVNLEPNGYCSEHPCGAIQPGLVERGTESRIIDGSDAQVNAWPWQMSVEVQDGTGGWTLTCGAVLIAENWALTAAHCFDNAVYPLRFLAGVYKRSDPINLIQERLVYTAQVTVHPEYNPNDRMLNDIAIVRFGVSYNLSTAAIRNICLPPSADSLFYENPQCYITGWGITEVGGTTPADVLQRAGMEVIKPWNCELYTEIPTRDSEVCILDQGERSAVACEADLGGPLSCLINTRFQLAGIGSSSQCNFRQPQSYSNVPYYLDWIRQVTGIQS